MEIRPYNSSDRDAVKELYRHAYDGDVERKFKAFDWIQTGNPAESEADGYLLAVEDGQILGYWGRMPVRLYSNGQPCNGVFAQEALVLPKSRRRGIAAGLAREGNSSKRLMVSLWHNEMIVGVIAKTGWQLVGKFRPLKKIFNYDQVLRLKLGRKRMLAPIAALVAAAAKLRRGPRPLRTEWQLEEVTRFGSDFDDFFAGVAPKYGLIADRTSPVLNWKYIDIPHQENVAVCARRGQEILGYAIVSTMETRDGVKKGTIVDLLAAPDDGDVVASLIAWCDEFFCANDVAFAICQTPAPDHRLQFRKRGYYEGKARITESLWVRNVEYAPNPQQASTYNEWYFTFGDSDGQMW